jgi:outer membrane protein
MAQKIQKAEEGKDGINILSIVSFVLSLVAIAFAAIVYFNKKEIVYVEAQKLVVGYNGMKTIRKEFEDKSGVWKANLDTLQREVTKKVQEYESRKGKLSIQERKLSEELINLKQEQFLNYQEVVKEKIQKEELELTKKVLDDINNFIKQYGRRNRYSIILAATQYGNIVYAKEGIDITDDVLMELNQNFGH